MAVQGHLSEIQLRDEEQVKLADGPGPTMQSARGIEAAGNAEIGHFEAG